MFLEQFFLLAAPVLKPELDLVLGKAQRTRKLVLLLVRDKAATLVCLLQLRPLVRGIPLERACPGQQHFGGERGGKRDQRRH